MLKVVLDKVVYFIKKYIDEQTYVYKFFIYKFFYKAMLKVMLINCYISLSIDNYEQKLDFKTHVEKLS